MCSCNFDVSLEGDVLGIFLFHHLDSVQPSCLLKWSSVIAIGWQEIVEPLLLSI